MRDALRGAVIGAVVLALLGAIASRGGWAAVAIPRPDGAGPWIVTRATGFAAFAALALDVNLGLVLSTRIGDRWIARGHAIELHRWLSPLALALVLGHALVLLADHHVRFDLIDVAVPFAASYRPVAVGLGVIAGYLALIVHASFRWRSRLGTRAWRRLHVLSFAAYAAAALHAIRAGSDASQPWAIALYGVPLVVTCALIAVRLLHRLRDRLRTPGTS